MLNFCVLSKVNSGDSVIESTVLTAKFSTGTIDASQKKFFKELWTSQQNPSLHRLIKIAILFFFNLINPNFLVIYTKFVVNLHGSPSLLLGNFPKKKPLHPRAPEMGCPPGLKVSRTFGNLVPLEHAEHQPCHPNVWGFFERFVDAWSTPSESLNFQSQCFSSKCNFTKSSHTKIKVRSQNLKKKHCCYSIFPHHLCKHQATIFSTNFEHTFHTSFSFWNSDQGMKQSKSSQFLGVIDYPQKRVLCLPDMRFSFSTFNTNEKQKNISDP